MWPAVPCGPRGAVRSRTARWTRRMTTPPPPRRDRQHEVRTRRPPRRPPPGGRRGGLRRGPGRVTWRVTLCGVRAGHAPRVPRTRPHPSPSRSPTVPTMAWLPVRRVPVTWPARPCVPPEPARVGPVQPLGPRELVARAAPLTRSRSLPPRHRHRAQQTAARRLPTAPSTRQRPRRPPLRPPSDGSHPARRPLQVPSAEAPVRDPPDPRPTRTVRRPVPPPRPEEPPSRTPRPQPPPATCGVPSPPCRGGRPEAAGSPRRGGVTPG